MSWYCDQCGDYHARGECPRGSFGVGKPDTGDEYEDAISRVDHALAHVRGQRDRDYVARVLDDLADRINTATSEWGDELRRRYLDHPQLGDRLTPRAPDIGHNAPPESVLTADQKELVGTHYYKFIKEAKRYSKGDPTLLDELITVGIEKACELAPEWNANRGVTFGKHIEKHLWGAMRDHAKRRAKTVHGLSEDAVEAITRKSGRKLSKPPTDKTQVKKWSKADAQAADYLRSVGGYPVSATQSDVRQKQLDAMVDRFLEAGGTVKRTTPPLNEQLEEAIGRLNQRQQMVYRECVLKDTPIETVAGRLDIRHASQISRIKKQAVEKVTARLKVSNKAGIL